MATSVRASPNVQLFPGIFKGGREKMTPDDLANGPSNAMGRGPLELEEHHRRFVWCIAGQVRPGTGKRIYRAQLHLEAAPRWTARVPAVEARHK